MTTRNANLNLHIQTLNENIFPHKNKEKTNDYNCLIQRKYNKKVKGSKIECTNIFEKTCEISKNNIFPKLKIKCKKNSSIKGSKVLVFLTQKSNFCFNKCKKENQCNISFARKVSTNSVIGVNSLKNKNEEEQNIVKDQEIVCEIGPGSYNPKVNLIKRRSNSIKFNPQLEKKKSFILNFLEEIETNKKLLITKLPTQDNIKRNSLPNYIFQSKTKKCFSPQFQKNNPGPGYYNSKEYILNDKVTKFNKCEKFNNFFNKNNFMIKKSSREKLPPVGLYGTDFKKKLIKVSSSLKR